MVVHGRVLRPPCQRSERQMIPEGGFAADDREQE